MTIPSKKSKDVTLVCRNLDDNGDPRKGIEEKIKTGNDFWFVSKYKQIFLLFMFHKDLKIIDKTVNNNLVIKVNQSKKNSQVCSIYKKIMRCGSDV